MDSTELSQFIFILAVALAAFVAAPIVAYLAEASDRRAEREHERTDRPWAEPRFA
jgi:hypothetical protein